MRRDLQKMLEIIKDSLGELEASELQRDIEGARVVQISPDNTVFQFDVTGYRRPCYSGQKPYSMQLFGTTDDGRKVAVILFKDRNCRLLELEIIPLFLDVGRPILVDISSLVVAPLK